MDFEMTDMTGQPRSRRDVEDALRFVEREMLTDPIGMTKDGVPRLIFYMTIRDVLRDYLRALSSSASPAGSEVKP